MATEETPRTDRGELIGTEMEQLPVRELIGAIIVDDHTLLMAAGGPGSSDSTSLPSTGE